MSAEPTEADLELVAEHGSNTLTRALATVELAERQGRMGELERLLDNGEVSG